MISPVLACCRPACEAAVVDVLLEGGSAAAAGRDVPAARHRNTRGCSVQAQAVSLESPLRTTALLTSCACMKQRGCIPTCRHEHPCPGKNATLTACGMRLRQVGQQHSAGAAGNAYVLLQQARGLQPELCVHVEWLSLGDIAAPTY